MSVLLLQYNNVYRELGLLTNTYIILYNKTVFILYVPIHVNYYDDDGGLREYNNEKPSDRLSKAAKTWKFIPYTRYT